MTKCCTGCGENKDSANEFYSHPRKPGQTVARCKTCVKSYHKDWYRNRGGFNVVRKSSLKKKYGISPELFDEMLAKQDGMCANKGCPNPGTELDHNHETNKVRSILCQACNLSLGQLKDSPVRILGLADYIRSHQ